MAHLEQIKQPEDVKRLTQEEIKTLAQEIREEIVGVVSQNGGHLASSLGVVELTLALARVFRFPEDKVVWDVGHQSYAYKILTSRKEAFASLRQYKGLAGFPKRSESEYDSFGTGHSSTSISAALGFAEAGGILKRAYYSIAVIGDGSMSSGMAYEAMNHAGMCKSNLIVILNDNEMFISKNVGAMSHYLTRIRTKPTYDKSKQEIEAFLSGIPAIGGKMTKAVRKAKDSLKYILLPGRLFEELGFTYLGPIDGHDVAAMEEVLTQAKNKRGPVMIHVVTKKGYGYVPAMANPDVYHGVGPFDKETGKISKKNAPPSYTEVFGKTLCQLAQDNQKIVAVTAAMGNGTGLSTFGDLHPGRFFDVGIAEQHAVTFGAALAFSGLKPVVSMYSTFYQRAYDQVLHDICLQDADVVLAVDRAGVVGEDGPTHHGVFDIAFFRTIPNLVLMAPKDENELRHMLYTALAIPGPVALRYPRANGQGVSLDEEFQLLEPGKAELLRAGGDLTLIGFGPLVYRCLEAAEDLAKQGVEAGVINLRFVNPVDRETVLREATLTRRIITVEDHALSGGMGSAILELLADAGLAGIRVQRLGYRDYVEHGPSVFLQHVHGLGKDDIVRAARRLSGEGKADEG